MRSSHSAQSRIELNSRAVSAIAGDLIGAIAIGPLSLGTSGQGIPYAFR
jgi:hypothetical protein